MARYETDLKLLQQVQRLDARVRRLERVLSRLQETHPVMMTGTEEVEEAALEPVIVLEPKKASFMPVPVNTDQKAIGETMKRATRRMRPGGKDLPK